MCHDSAALERSDGGWEGGCQAGFGGVLFVDEDGDLLDVCINSLYWRMLASCC